jgi:glycine/D-amino acid oxidase-like deaminating enzyme
VVGASTSRGDIEAEAVVISAGAWSKALSATCGVNLPIEMSLEQELIVAADAESAPVCCVSSLIDAIYLRPFPAASTPDGKVGVLLGRGYPKEYETVDPDNVPAKTTPEFESELRERVARRQPQLAAAPTVSSRAAVYDFTPDWHPVLGPTKQAAGLYFATGGSGHGFKLGPAIGEMVASAHVNQPVRYASVEPFSVDRFAAGELFTAAYGGNRA